MAKKHEMAEEVASEEISEEVVVESPEEKGPALRLVVLEVLGEVLAQAEVLSLAEAHPLNVGHVRAAVAKLVEEG